MIYCKNLLNNKLFNPLWDGYIKCIHGKRYNKDLYYNNQKDISIEIEIDYEYSEIIILFDQYVRDGIRIKTENNIYEGIVISINESEKYNLVNSVDKAWYVATLITYSIIKSWNN
jgi:hypothetical protein|nr:MAG TPA: hypothetical protein [Caudoviricetes sp.]